MKSLTAWFYSVFTAALILGISVIGLQAPRPMIDVRTIPLITHQGGLTPLHVAASQARPFVLRTRRESA